MLLAPATESVADVILRACQAYWSQGECVFQDGGEYVTHPFSDRWVWTVGANRKEFSVYRNTAAAEAWKEKRAVRSNANTMFHFILGNEVTDGGLVEVAMIFDKFTPEVRAFIKELQTALLLGKRARLRRAG